MPTMGSGRTFQNIKVIYFKMFAAVEVLISFSMAWDFTVSCGFYENPGWISTVTWAKDIGNKCYGQEII